MVLAMTAAAACVMAVPDLAMWLPRAMGLS
jgi:hypothetical protein